MTTAAAVSAALARGGRRPLGSGAPFLREGIRVKQCIGYVRVSIDIDSPRGSADATEDVITILEAAGYTIERAGTDAIPALIVKR